MRRQKRKMLGIFVRRKGLNWLELIHFLNLMPFRTLLETLVWRSKWHQIYLFIIDCIGIDSSSFLLTSMLNTVSTSSDWLGDLAAAFLPPTGTGKSDCLGLSTLGIAGVDCDSVSNFVCQAPDPPTYEPFPSMRFKNIRWTFFIIWGFHVCCSKILNSLLPLDAGMMD